MPKPTIDIPLDETEEKARPPQERKASRIDIPLDEDGKRPGPPRHYDGRAGICQPPP